MGKSKGRGRGRGRGRGAGGRNEPPGHSSGPPPGRSSVSPPGPDVTENATDDDYPALGGVQGDVKASIPKPASCEGERPAQRSVNQPPAQESKSVKGPAEQGASGKSPPQRGNTGKPPAQVVDPQDRQGHGAEPPAKQTGNCKPPLNKDNGEGIPKTQTIHMGSLIQNKSVSMKEFDIPKRPGFGKAGRVIDLRANFFKIKIPDADVYHYDVTINDGKNVDKCPKKLNRHIIEKMVDQYLKDFGDRPVYDGTKNLYKMKPLRFSGTKEFKVEIEEEGRKRTFKVSLKEVNQINLKALEEMMNGRRGVSVPQTAIQALDLVLRHAACMRYVSVGPKLFTPSNAKNIGSGLEVWSGYFQSVRPTLWKPMLNIDVCATAFYQSVDVIEFLYEITKYDCTKTRNKLRDLERKKFSKEIKGLKIEITYDGHQRRKYRVNKLTRESASELTFPLEKNGKTTNVTVQNYFKTEKNVHLKYPWLPCLHVGNPQKNVYIPMEGCKLIPSQRCLKRLNEDQTANMIRCTAMKPEQRAHKIIDIVRDANFARDPYLKSFGVQVDTQMQQVKGRVLDTPGIIYHGGGKPMVPRGGAWNMKGLKLLQGATINSWGVIIYNLHRPLMRPEEVERFINELMKSCKAVGIRVDKPPCYKRSAAANDTAAKIVSEAIKTDQNIEFLVVILPGKTQFYADLKRICDTENGYTEISDPGVKEILKKRGLSTQCIQAKNASKCNPMTLAQLCLKINMKMGGMNNNIDPRNNFTRPARIFQEPVIFLGADVTHPGIGDKTSPSIAAVVGSVDAIPSKYAVCVRVQKHRVEIIEDLCAITVELLKQFYRSIRKKPTRIIMFRDGVSEGQFQQVLHHELVAMREACTKLEKGYQPAITFIVVQKRHHARFMVTDPKDADRSGNCPPGTTIDTGVCHPSEYDFYQYGHSGIQGTSRPTHYHVLWDDLDLKADELQALSFMLCHLYVRCTRSVSVPAPAYYAHHVAFRARYHLQKEDGSNSSDSGKDDISDRMDALNLKEIVKPHPNLASRMYFV